MINSILIEGAFDAPFFNSIEKICSGSAWQQETCCYFDDYRLASSSLLSPQIK